ncbi:hypothetical protein AU195_20555 [Mycobacterium sp. IS-1496]|uniref:TIR domain-containing protein n=1 Tax=Mycobacterium sp. IS-1496 TaxID=1772284 RepID=UPI0007417199|nr:TIR domain-containing protein [Mycobacterium sp. IS-1496]KUI28155.1 hypothetical protein AU195_20555 [Mycobacterium sp. IS-1496]
MARHVYFAFDYQDVFKVNQVRRAGQFVGIARAGFLDASQWEKLKLLNRAVIKRTIDASLINTSVTVVVVGARTASREWVRYELDASIARGNGLLGVYLPGESGHPKPSALERVGAPLFSFDLQRFATWVEAAALRAGRL